MGQGIQDFYTVAQNRDFARLFQFRVLQIGNSLLGEQDLVYLESATLPGRSINNVPVPYMGLSFNVPGTASYPGSAGYKVNFRCDANYQIRAELERLTFNTFNDDTSSGDYTIPKSDSILHLDLYTSGMASFDQPMVKVRSYQLVGVYVVSIDDTNYTITDTGTVATVGATLAYQFWRTVPTNAAPINTILNNTINRQR